MTKKEAKIIYGKDANEWLERWDKGETVWSIEMGGLGPGYEQAIQITVAEILRDMILAKYNHGKWEDQDTWNRDLEEIRKVLDTPAVSALGLSGAQWGGAINVASRLYAVGPATIMSDEAVKDRHIQISKHFPG